MSDRQTQSKQASLPLSWLTGRWAISSPVEYKTGGWIISNWNDISAFLKSSYFLLGQRRRNKLGAACCCTGSLPIGNNRKKDAVRTWAFRKADHSIIYPAKPSQTKTLSVEDPDSWNASPFSIPMHQMQQAGQWHFASNDDTALPL